MQSLNRNGVSITQAAEEKKFVKYRSHSKKGYFTSTTTATRTGDCFP